MKSFKSIIALVLCAVMLVGIVPMAFNGSKVVAADEPSTAIDAVVQGPKDAVIIYDVDMTFREAFNAFVGNKVLVSGNKYGVGGTASGAAYDRIILVMAINERLGDNNTAFEGTTYKFTDMENIVITSKCYAEYTDNVYLYTGTGYDSLMPMNTAIAFGKATNPFTDNLIDKTADVQLTLVDYTATGGKTIRFACDMAFEYITIKFTAHNLLCLSGYDLYISDTVKFVRTGTTNGYWPIIINGFDGSNTSANKFNSELNQTVTLEGGTYQYISMRSRNLFKTYNGNKITLNLGEVAFVGGSLQNVTAFMANDSYTGVTMTVNINGTTFDNDVYLVEGGTCSAANPVITNSTLNINVTNGTFNKGITPYFLYTGNTAYKDAVINSLNVNMHIDSCTIAEGNSIVGQNDAFATGINAKVEYPKGALFSSKITGFDTATELLVDLCVGGHTYIPAYIDEECCYACMYCSVVDETKTVSFEEASGFPVIYVDYATGNNANDGLTVDTPVKNVWKACEILSAWQQGGYVIVVGDAIKFDTHTTDGNDVACTLLADIGGPLYIDGNYNDEKGEGATALLTSNSGFVYFENDTVFRNITLYSTSNAKNWILNYNSFYATENCKQSDTANYNLSLFAGALNNTSGAIAKYATDKVVDQEIFIDGFCFQSIMTGSKSMQKDKVVTTENPNGEYCVRYSREYSVNCSGLTTVYVGASSKVDSINVRKHHYNSTEGKIDYNTAPEVRLYIESAALPEAGIKFVENKTYLASTRVYTVEAGADKNMFADDRALILYGDDFSDIASVLTVVDHEAFEHVANGYNEATSSARITFAEVDDSLQGDEIAEFGVLFCASELNEWPNYVYADGDQGLVAKSVCYDKAKNIENYLYDGENAASFRGVIVLDDEQYYDLDFAAVPYALVKAAAATDVVGAVAAEYCVIGMPKVTSFAEIVESAN